MAPLDRKFPLQQLIRFPAVLRDWCRLLVAALLLGFGVLYLGPSSGLDGEISDRLLRSQALPTDSAILIVEIGAEDIRTFGGPPISRAKLAEAIERLAAGGARRVLLDMHLGEALNAESDARLASAFARLGPDRLGLASGTTATDRPYQLFAEHGTLLDGRLTPDVDGSHRQIGRAIAGRGANPAIWLATGRADPSPVSLDIRVATRGFERRSLGQLLGSKDDLSGRLVVIGLSSAISPTRAVLPMSIRGDRVGVYALGTQSVRQDYQMARPTAYRIGSQLQLWAILLGFFCAFLARSGKSLVVLVLAGSCLMFAISLGIGRAKAIEVYPVRTLAVFLVMANITLIQRLRIVPMMGSFLRGDLSPEEVWAWRSHEQSANPALLLSFDGRIKRFNPAAAQLVDLHGEGLAQACLPKLGVKAEDFSLDDPEKGLRFFEAEWPNSHVPIVILRDVTDSQSSASALRRQLLTDELTGMANRRGFDHALQQASRGDQAYALYFLDMNGFKAVNDTYGHDAGDELLVRSARRLAECVRPSDTVARLGGDEFAILVNGAIGEAQALNLAAKLAAAIDAPFDLEASGCEVRVGVAVGFARSEEIGNDPAELLRRADKAMYRDKVRGKLKAAA